MKKHWHARSWLLFIGICQSVELLGSLLTWPVGSVLLLINHWCSCGLLVTAAALCGPLLHSLPLISSSSSPLLSTSPSASVRSVRLRPILLSCFPTSRPTNKRDDLARTAVVKAPKSSLVTPILSSLHWLEINERIEYKLLSLTYLQSSHNQPTWLPKQSDLCSVFR